jgi:hypothetical protein
VYSAAPFVFQERILQQRHRSAVQVFTGPVHSTFYKLYIKLGDLGRLFHLACLCGDIGTGSDNGASADDVMGKLAQNFKGASGRQAKSAEGQMRKLQLQLGNIAENVGKILLPVLETLAPILASISPRSASVRGR